jgi:hypothetical protein
MVVSLVSSLSEEQLLSLNLTSYWLSFDACGGPNAGSGFVDYFSKLYGAGLVEGLSVLFDNVVAPVDRAVGYEGETIIAIGEIIAFMVGFMSLLSRLPSSNGELRLIFLFAILCFYLLYLDLDYKIESNSSHFSFGLQKFWSVPGQHKHQISL